MEYTIFRTQSPKGAKIAGIQRGAIIIYSKTELGTFEPLHYVAAQLVDHKISRADVINADDIEKEYPFFWPTYEQLKKLVSPAGQALGKMFIESMKGGKNEN